MPHTKSGKIVTDLVLETFRLNGRLLAAGDRLTKPLELTSSRWQILGAIEHQAQSVAQVARRMGLARQNVQRLADVLEREGMVEYATNPDHRRAKLVRPSERGRKALAELARLQESWANDLARSVRQSDLQIALDVLRVLRSKLEANRGASIQAPE